MATLHKETGKGNLQTDSGLYMKIFRWMRAVLLESWEVSRPLFKIMIPIVIAVKVLKELGIISWLALPLEPVMKLVGLPASMGLVWATAMFNNIYSGIIVFVSLAQGVELSAAQVTVLATMILLAHSLPVELEIARQSGARVPFQCVVRVGGALLLGAVLNFVYTRFELLSEPAKLMWNAAPADKGWLAWILSQIESLAGIFFIIAALIAIMRVLDLLGVTGRLVSLLRPVLRVIGIGREAAPVTIVGMVLGLGYGGGLIIREARSGRVGKRDVFFALTLMGLSHSIIEDTLLMFLVGGHISGIFWGRILFTLLLVAALARWCTHINDPLFDKFLGTDVTDAESDQR